VFNFSGVSNKSLAGKILRLPLALVPKNLTTWICQGPLQGKKWVVGSSNHGYWLGSYEFDKQKLIAETVGKGAVFFDIGAHVGFYTLLASTLVGNTGKVYSFELLPRNLGFLKKHLKLNGVQNVTLFEAAVSDCPGESQFAEGPNRSMGKLSDHGAIKVQLVSLDDLLAAGKIVRPDYMKIDVEGAELSVLQGARGILADAAPVIFLATHGSEVHSQCISFLQSFGYTCRAIDGDQDLDRCDEIIATKAG